MTRTRKNVVKVVIAMVMMIVIALGGVAVFQYTVWHVAQTYVEEYFGNAGVIAENEYVDNKLKVEAHRLNGDEPVAWCYGDGVNGMVEEIVMHDRMVNVYEDGAFEIVSL